MQILSIIIFSISSSSDNFIIGLSYGAKKITISLLSNLIVSFISCIGTYAAMLFGSTISQFISPVYTNMVGSGIIILLGIYLMVSSLSQKQGRVIHSRDNGVSDNGVSKIHYLNNVIEHPEIVDTDNSKTIEFKEAVLLGSILCLNNVGLGIGASITGLNIYITSLCSLIFSFLFIKLGFYIGKKILSHRLSVYSEIVSACLIILLGIYELFL